MGAPEATPADATAATPVPPPSLSHDCSCTNATVCLDPRYLSPSLMHAAAMPASTAVSSHCSCPSVVPLEPRQEVPNVHDEAWETPKISLMSTPFIDNNDLFETSSTGGMSRELIDKIPKMRFSAASNCDQETDSSCCSVCLQDFGAQQFVRALPQCQHIFHVRCIDNWLLHHASCPLRRAGVHIDHIHM